MDKKSGLLTRKIPSTKEVIPAIGLGTWSTFDVADHSSQKSGLSEVLEIFTHVGGKIVDCSPMYGRAEKVAGDLMQEANARKNLFIATKVWTTGKQKGIDQINSSFKKFQTSVVDLLQVHNLTDVDTQIKTLQELKSEGRIRYTGITHYSTYAYPQLIRAIKTFKPDFVQFNYNIKIREAEKELIPVAQDNGTAIIINRPFEEGDLFSMVKEKALPQWALDYNITTWAQYFLKFILSHEAVTCVIPATGKAIHMRDIMNAGIGSLPDVTLRKKMIEYVAG